MRRGTANPGAQSVTEIDFLVLHVSQKPAHRGLLRFIYLARVGIDGGERGGHLPIARRGCNRERLSVRLGHAVINWVTILWSMAASACLTLALMHLVIWLNARKTWGNLLFSLSATGTALLAGAELWMMRSETTAEFGMALRWLHVPAWMVIVGLVWFVRLYLRAGRPWLAWTVCGLRTLSLFLNFLFKVNLNYREITSLRHIRLLGELVSVAQGIPNPWMVIGNLSLLTLVVFVVDATVAVWRRGDRRQALTIGGSMILFVILGTSDAILVLWGILQIPITATFFYMGFVFAMAFELNHDVLTAAKLSEELRESEQRMTMAAEAANFGIWIRDLSRNEIWASKKWRELFGFAPLERLDFDGFMRKLHPEDREAFRNVLDNAIADGTEYEMEYRVPLPGGGVRWLVSKGRAERDSKGRPVLIRGASRDCTARKQAEQEALRLREEVAHANRVTMLGQLAATLAHELNQPLGAILRNAEAAQLFLKMDVPDLPEVDAILADICKDDHRAGEVIDRMRALLRRRDPELKVFQVNRLVAEVTSFIRTDANKRHVFIETEVPDHLPSVRVDRVQFQQVLLNLIINGMDAVNGQEANERGVTVRARHADAGLVEIAVSDTGHGIPPEKEDVLFQPFYTTKPDGLGIGLAISRTIVEAHGGHIRAENNAKGGATFFVTLPAASEEAMA